jgi:hypothetical protein
MHAAELGFALPPHMADSGGPTIVAGPMGPRKQSGIFSLWSVARGLVHPFHTAQPGAVLAKPTPGVNSRRGYGSPLLSTVAAHGVVADKSAA